jgi:hypothetical protein
MRQGNVEMKREKSVTNTKIKQRHIRLVLVGIN